MDSVAEPGVHTVVVKSSAQVGKTEFLNNIVGFHVDNDPAPIMVVQPTVDMGQAWSKDRLAPMLRDTPALQGKIADPKSRDSDNTILHKSFPGGHITISGANSAASLASRPIRILLQDEVDRYPASAGSEGDPVKLGDRRTETFWNAVKVRTSTPTVKGFSRIDDEFERSDKRFFNVQCEDCDGWQVLKWAQVVWPEGKPEEAVYACEHCGSLWDDVTRWRAVRGGEWRATAKFNGVAGFHIWAAYSPWVKLGDKATEFLQVKSKPDQLKTFVNTVLGETWEDEGEGVAETGLLARREPYGPESIPDDVVLVTAGVDTQNDRLEISVYGWGADQESWLLEHAVLRGDPGSPELWQELDDYLTDVFVRDDGRAMHVEAVAIDSGGHYTEAVYEFCSKRKRRRVWAIKGQSGPARTVWPTRASRTKKKRVDLFIVGVDAAKEILYSRLNKVHSPGPGYIHFPSDVDEEFFAQLTAEQVLTKYSRGRPVREWHAKRERNEALDCFVYAYAAMIGRGVDLNKRAAGAEDSDEKKTARQRPGRSRGGFAKAW